MQHFGAGKENTGILLFLMRNYGSQCWQLCTKLFKFTLQFWFLAKFQDMNYAVLSVEIMIVV